VDRNPLAVDLCKVALWIEGHSPGLPLSFLDNHVRCGDALIGVFDIDSPVTHRFDDDDQAGLEAIAACFLAACNAERRA
jgi:hypothetical protein